MAPKYSVDSRDLVVHGTVEHGDHRGRTLGFPTANIDVSAISIAHGVWAGWFERSEGGVYPAAVSVGVRSTFYGRNGVKLLEAHLLDFEGDLYGESVRVSLAKRLRGQKKFASLDDLVEQLALDIALTREWAEGDLARVVRPRRRNSVELPILTP